MNLLLLVNYVLCFKFIYCFEIFGFFTTKNEDYDIFLTDIVDYDNEMIGEDLIYLKKNLIKNMILMTKKIVDLVFFVEI